MIDDYLGGKQDGSQQDRYCVNSFGHQSQRFQYNNKENKLITDDVDDDCKRDYILFS